MSAYDNFLKKLPGVSGPIKKLSFSEKLKWTALILFIYLLMTQVVVFGVDRANVPRLAFLEIVLGSSFGSLVTLGIGPIVTSSIILQLLVGSKIIPWNLQSEEGKARFQGTQKLLAISFSFIEAYIFVAFGAVPAVPGAGMIVMLQLALGGIVILFMDEVVTKWGFGSGVGLFILAGVSKGILIGIFNPLAAGCIPGQIDTCIPDAANPPAGRLPYGILALGTSPVEALLQGFLPVIATVLVIIIAVYSQLIRVEVPLAFGGLSGFGRRWPLKFFYTSNMPVILISALLANVQLVGRMLSQRGGSSILGTFDTQGNPTGGLIYYLFPPQSIPLSSLMVFIGLFAILGAVFLHFTKKNGLKYIAGFALAGALVWYGISVSTGLTSLLAVSLTDVLRMATYSLFLIGGSVVFGIFWVQTSGMDSKSVANQIDSVGMYVAGHRRDPRIIESVLQRYIPHLTVLGGAAVGALAAFADFTFAIGTGTGILLGTMIAHQMYEQIVSQHSDDIPPRIKKFIGEG